MARPVRCHCPGNYALLSPALSSLSCCRSYSQWAVSFVAGGLPGDRSSTPSRYESDSGLRCCRRQPSRQALQRPSRRGGQFGTESRTTFLLSSVATLVAGATLAFFLAKLVSRWGVGNGFCLIFLLQYMWPAFAQVHNSSRQLASWEPLGSPRVAGYYRPARLEVRASPTGGTYGFPAGDDPTVDSASIPARDTPCPLGLRYIQFLLRAKVGRASQRSGAVAHRLYFSWPS